MISAIFLSVSEAVDVIFNNGSDDVTLVKDTDYTLDLVMGRVFFLTTATKIGAGVEVDFTLTAEVTAKGVDEVRALTQTSVLGALKFIGLGETPTDIEPFDPAAYMDALFGEG